MKRFKEGNLTISTLLVFALIPISGLATDIYIPSLPSMANDLHVSTSQVQLSLLLFFISSGFSQLFTGAIVDSFGRYRVVLLSLIVFAAASFSIAMFPNILIFLSMRVIQGVAVSFIIISKRAFFSDVYSGDRLAHYSSLFIIIWTTAPVVSPFIGGYLQKLFGWQADFYFLGIFAIFFLVIELLFNGESLKQFQPFQARPIIQVYKDMLGTKDFTLGLIITGCCYGTVLVYAMASPFIIERSFHLSPVFTGYCALLSGVFIMLGGAVAKAMLSIPISRKIPFALGSMLLFALLIFVTGSFGPNIYLMIGLSLGLHASCSVVFNTFYAYCLMRFKNNAGTASGLTGGGMYMVNSIVSYGLVYSYHINGQTLLGAANITGVALVISMFIIFNKYMKILKKEKSAVPNLHVVA
jgi:DHA1 family bicyclomycin/chloramphenicol resistance-like MFS transporter